MKRALSLLCTLALIFSFSGCGSRASALKSFDKKAENALISDNLIAENDRYRLEFDKETYGVVMTELSSGEKWAVASGYGEAEEYDDYGMPVKKHPRTQSAIVLKYKDYKTNSVYQQLSYSDANRVRCARTDNALLVEFYFDTAKIMIPVEYRLLKDSVQITVDPKRIEEDENSLLEISVAPFMCSVKNNSAGNYLFVPSGSGALIDTKVVSEQGNTFSEQIYGIDRTKEQKTETSVGEAVKLPVFGARISDGKGIAAIITSGAESGLIEASSGSSALGYAAVYTTFQVRGYTGHTAQIYANKKSTNNVYSKLTVNKKFSVRYYPLTGDKADYNGIAECYRNYLDESGDLPHDCKDVPLAVNFVGGTTVTKSFLGIPYRTLSATTTITEAENIVSDLQKRLDTGFPVKLTGFGKSGVDIDEVAGGYAVGKNVGSINQLKALKKAVGEKGGALYMDFDLEHFSSSSHGFSTYSDTVYDTTDKKSLQYLYNVATRDYNKLTKHYLLRHESVSKAADKLIKKTDGWAIDGISLSSLSSTFYSDYRDKTTPDYYCGSGMPKLVSKIFENVKKSGKSVMANNANAYAATDADIITDAPVTSSGNNIFYAEIPFYETVFKGYIPMVSSSQNLSADHERLLLKSVESGCGLGYTLTARWDNSLIDAAYPLFYNSVYDEVVPLIVDNYSRLKEYYNNTDGAHISKHRILENGVRETVFDNGTAVYVNYGDTAAASPAGEVAPLDFIVKEGTK